jgi:hypothetical protein
MQSRKLNTFSHLVNLDNANPREAAIFWSKALSRLAQLGGQSDEKLFPWTADRVLAIIEDDGHANNFLTRPEIIKDSWVLR